MRPRWTRSDPTARTDRLAAVVAPVPPAPRMPRTLRLRAVAPRRGLTDPRALQLALALQRSMDHGYPAVVLPDSLQGVELHAAPHVLDAIERAADTALASLAEPHARAQLHAADECARCTATELCPWHYARLRSWWDARDRAAATLLTAIDTALAGRPS